MSPIMIQSMITSLQIHVVDIEVLYIKEYVLKDCQLIVVLFETTR